MASVSVTDSSAVGELLTLLSKSLPNVSDTTAVTDTVVKLHYDWVDLARDTSTWTTQTKS